MNQGFQGQRDCYKSVLMERLPWTQKRILIRRVLCVCLR
jgi:hypothetical protein